MNFVYNVLLALLILAFLDINFPHEILPLNLGASFFWEALDVQLSLEANNTITFELRNSGGVVIDDTTLTISSGQQTIDLNLNVPIANDMQLGISQGALQTSGLYRNNSNADYPYDIASAINITSSSANTDPLSYYYFFYDIEVEVLCIAVVNGCTDATACNYDASANVDDGSCNLPNGCGDALYLEYDSLVICSDASACITLISCTDVTITVGGGTYDSEIGWSLVDGSGVTVASGGAPYSAIACLADDCYTMNMTDSYPDGWNGATYSITDNNSGTAYGTGGLIGSTTSSGSDNISIGFACPVSGCTDSTATNYDPLAVVDDGSCCLTSICIGSTYQGGIIFWLDGNGGGLIAAPSNQDFSAEWGCDGYPIFGAEGTAIGTGNQNTIDIEAGCSSSGTAADICANLTLGGYSDWFLPSRNELNEMYLNIGQGNALGLGNIGGFANNFYWSSSEYDSYSARGQFFNDGIKYNVFKYSIYLVRAVRAF